MISGAATFSRNFYAGIARHRFYDRAMRVPIVAYSLFVLARDVLGFYEQVAAQPAAFVALDAGIVISAMARVSQWMFIALLAILPIFRLRPLARSGELLPRLAALLAVCLPASFLLLERAPANVWFNAASMLIGLAANMMCVVTVSFLGRSLSVMPEARRLVTNGPYAQVRHPLYLCEVAGLVAVVLQYRSVAVVALFALTVALQAVRGCWEEQVLARAFPDFAAYRLRTPFFLPRDTARFLVTFFTDPAARLRSLQLIGATLMLLILAVVALPRLIV